MQTTENDNKNETTRIPTNLNNKNLNSSSFDTTKINFTDTIDNNSLIDIYKYFNPTTTITTLKPFQLKIIHKLLLNNINETSNTNKSKISIKNNNIIVEAPTGTGKTLCYLLPVLYKYFYRKLNKAVILVPTHELAHQIYNQIVSNTNTNRNDLDSKNLLEDVLLLIGNNDINSNIKNVDNDINSNTKDNDNIKNLDNDNIKNIDKKYYIDLTKYKIIISTPAKFTNTLKYQKLNKSNINSKNINSINSNCIDFLDYLILDEADKLIDRFKSYLIHIITKFKNISNFVCLSATATNLYNFEKIGRYKFEEMDLIKLNNNKINNNRNLIENNINLKLYYLQFNSIKNFNNSTYLKLINLLFIIHLFNINYYKKIIVFFSTTVNVEYYYNLIKYYVYNFNKFKNIFDKNNTSDNILYDKNILDSIFKLHGRLTNLEREEIFNKLPKISELNEINTLNLNNLDNNYILFTTDLSARGIDLHCDLVIHYDFPIDPSNIIHRTGRTARNNNKGVSIVFGYNNEYGMYNYINNTYNKLLDKQNENNIISKIDRITDLMQNNQNLCNNSINLDILNINYKIIYNCILHPQNLLLTKFYIQSNRNLLDLSIKSFVSYISYYTQHTLNYLLNYKELNLDDVISVYHLKKIPNIKEVQNYKFSDLFNDNLNVSLDNFELLNILGVVDLGGFIKSYNNINTTLNLDKKNDLDDGNSIDNIYLLDKLDINSLLLELKKYIIQNISNSSNKDKKIFLNKREKVSYYIRKSKKLSQSKLKNKKHKK